MEWGVQAELLLGAASRWAFSNGRGISSYMWGRLSKKQKQMSLFDCLQQNQRWQRHLLIACSRCPTLQRSLLLKAAVTTEPPPQQRDKHPAKGDLRQLATGNEQLVLCLLCLQDK